MIVASSQGSSHLFFIPCKLFSASIVPRVCSLDNPSFIFKRRISFLTCLLLFCLPYFSFIWYMRNITPFDYLLCSMNFDLYVLSIKTQMLMHHLSFFLCERWFRRSSLENYGIIKNVCNYFYIMFIGGCCNSRYWYSFFIC